MIPDLNIEDARFLKEVIQLQSNGDMTDIEELDSLVNGGLRVVEQKYPNTAMRFRKLMCLKRGEIGPSPVVEAVKTRKHQVLTNFVLLTVVSWQTNVSLSSRRGLCSHHFVGFGSDFHVAPSNPISFRHMCIP
jgi:hypothetical protein